ncbi:Hypothetical predicted protein [Cloeon dipterum]|uniref:SH3 domain-containing protein n=1 Tax=Cloeon dipterum TaxID=197152 RepID=A0A8S1D3M6_9INSE|nr:Hypothetical predicted protein [Cloeon dipterum]
MSQLPENFGPNMQKCMARALYDNIAESSDELAFRRGDVLTVLEQNTGGIEGWWLCTLRGRQGICPGNRLRLIAGVPEEFFEESSYLGEEIASLQRRGNRRSLQVQSNRVVTPQRVGDIYLYDLPPHHTQNLAASGRNHSQPVISASGESYDVPRPSFQHVQQSYDTPRSMSSASSSPLPPADCSSYDVPRPHVPVQLPQPPPQLQHQQQAYDVPQPRGAVSPASSISSLATNDSCSQYDVPPPPVKTRSSATPTPQPANTASHVMNPAMLLYDVPPTVTKDVTTTAALPLELTAALETLSRLEAELQASAGKLLGFVAPNWRCLDSLEPRVLDLKLAAHRVRTALQDLLRFGEGALGNAINAPDKGLAPKMNTLIRHLKTCDSIITAALEMIDWTAVFRDDASAEAPDALDKLIAVAKELPDNCRQTCSFIQGNAPLLFKRDGLGEGLEDYDYVNLESKTSLARQHLETKANLPLALREHYETLVTTKNEIEVPNLDPSDKRVLSFFAAQAGSHASNLTMAIDAFLLTIEQNQPPASFLAHGKFVVLSAHKLVSIGDSVHRHVGCSVVRSKVLQASNALSDALASAVNKTKKAALHFPSVAAVQEMVDGVVDISHLAKELKVQISQAAAAN